MSSGGNDHGPGQSMLPTGSDQPHAQGGQGAGGAGDEELTQPVTRPDVSAEAPASEAAPAARPKPESVREGVLTVEDHLEKILRGIGPLAPYEQPLVESLGLPIHEAFVSPIDLPRFDNSSMDGYAVRAEDIQGANRQQPVTLPVVGEISAGSAKPFAISAGTAVK
ncbi:MAG: molybdopterin molybdenumtransferase MoeA, partial [Aeromicrobium sp.]|nr:molybdopterin molybdenumtransferase MoeA [Aeromicrobium sp.]